MARFTCTALATAAAAFAFGLSTAQAQDAPSVAVTPFVALGSNGSSPFGVAITFPVASSVGIESEVGYRRGEGGIHALSAGASLLFDLPRVGRTVPYLAIGGGLAEYGAPVIAPASVHPIATQALVAPTVNAGGGLKMPVSDTWGMRTDARWFKSFGRHGSEHFRVAQGISFDVPR
jgi:hypothetical protein